MGIQLPGDLMPGAVGVVETQTASATISDSATEATVTFTLEGDFDAAADMAVLHDGDVSALSAGSASTEVSDTDADRQNMTTGSVDVTATLDAAPGTGETTDVVVSVVVAEGGD